MKDLLVKFFRSRTRKDDLNYAELIKNQFGFFRRIQFTKVINELSILDFGSEDYINKKNELRTMAETLERKTSLLNAAYVYGKLGLASVVGLSSVAAPMAAYAQEQVEQKPFVMPSDDELKVMMKQYVEETLKDTNVVYVKDNNYQREVFQEYTDAELNAMTEEQREKAKIKRPAMVIFYGRDNSNKYSEALGALVKIVHEEFPQIKLCAYNAGYSGTYTSELRILSSKYPLKELPSLLFYDVHNGKVEIEIGDGTTMNTIGGPKSKGQLKEWLKYYEKQIPQYLSLKQKDF